MHPQCCPPTQATNQLKFGMLFVFLNSSEVPMRSPNTAATVFKNESEYTSIKMTKLKCHLMYEALGLSNFYML